MKKLLLAFVAGLVVNASNGGTVIWRAASDNGFVRANGTSMLPVGSLVRLGYFANGVTDAQIAANATSPSGLSTIDANFTELDFSRIGGPEVLGNPGYFQDSVNIPDPDSAGIVGKQLTLLVYFSTDNSSVSLSKSTALEFGVFYLQLGANSPNNQWGVLSDNPVPSSATLDITDLTGAGPTAGLSPTAHLVVGSLTQGTAGFLNARNFQLVSVPEPTSVGLLVAAGTVFGFVRRRR
jgi:hypothetical protein